MCESMRMCEWVCVRSLHSTPGTYKSLIYMHEVVIKSNAEGQEALYRMSSVLVDLPGVLFSQQLLCMLKAITTPPPPPPPRPHTHTYTQKCSPPSADGFGKL